MMKKVVTLGEIMLRLSAPNYQKIVQAQSFDAVYGGERLGIYFFEKGYSIRSSKVYYDRKNSAFAMSKVEEYDFDTIFADADWFHISGITPALNEELFQLTKKALEMAKEKGLTTSCDLNYRSALWSFEQAREKMTELIKYVDVCIGIEPLTLLGEDGKDIKDQLPEEPSMEDYLAIMKQLHERYGIRYVAMTKRDHVSVNCNRLKAYLYDGRELYQSTEVEVDIIDRVGTGDAFSAGIIYSLISEYKPQDAVEFATGCFALKHTIERDANLIPISDVEKYMSRSFSINR